MAYLSIFDASSLLYAGHKAKAYSPRSDIVYGDPVINGLPVGGLRYAVRYILNILARGDDVIVCFDSRTDRNKNYEDYKGNRTMDPAIYVQQLMLFDFISALQIPFLKVDNFEADDLVYSAMCKFRSKYARHVIYSGDTDLAANIWDEKTTLLGVASIYPTITRFNFEVLVKSNTLVPFNTILPYYAIYGKQSNNVAPLADSKTNDELFASYISFTEENGYTPGGRSSRSYFVAWLNSLLKDETKLGYVQNLISRIDCVFPRAYAINDDFKFKKFRDLDKTKLAFYLKTFGLDTLLHSFKCEGVVSEGRSRAMTDYLAMYKKMFTSGTLAVDAGMSPDDSYFSEETTFFVNGEDF